MPNGMAEVDFPPSPSGPCLPSLYKHGYCEKNFGRGRDGVFALTDHGWIAANTIEAEIGQRRARHKQAWSPHD